MEKRREERRRERQGLETMDRVGWLTLGTRAMHCTAMSSGRPGIMTAAAATPEEVEVCSAIDGGVEVCLES